MQKKIATMLCLSLALAAVEASAGDISLKKSTRVKGFITPVKEGVDLRTLENPAQHMNWLCALAESQFRIGCPRTLAGPVFPDPVDGFNSDHLPHLKVVIGITSASASEPPQDKLFPPLIGWEFASSVVTTSVPAPYEPGAYYPSVGKTGPLAVYLAIVENGCVGVPATVDISLVNDVLDVTAGPPGVALGEVSLSDEIDGWGDYLWSSSVDTVDGSGTPNTFTTTGFIDAFCTSDTEID